MPRPHLILDCYLDEQGAAGCFTPWLEGRPCEVVRPPRGGLPRRASDFAALWVSGSAASVLDPDPWIAGLVHLLRDALAQEVPVLGICFGHQALAAAAGGREAVRRAPCSELGWTAIEWVGPSPLWEGLPPRFSCFVSHYDEVVPGTPGLEVLARSDRCAVHAFQVRDKPAFGVQFHPEMHPEECRRLVRVNLTRHGHLGDDPELVLREEEDGRPLGALLARNFLRRLLPAQPAAQPKRPVT
jgi:GMP synthase-like glutamine amidotransferase